MALKIRLRQQGCNNRAFYRLVVTDSRSPRDGKYVEALGWYNPVEVEDEKKLAVKPDRIQHWLNLGAQLSENAAHLVRQGAPELMLEQAKKKDAKRAKITAKRKERKKVRAS